MLEQLVKNGFGKDEDYNCAEKVLYGANEVYGLGLDTKALKMAAAFGGGMGTGRTCGAVAAALMVIGAVKTEKVAHQSPEVKAMAVKFQEDYEGRMKSIDCAPLKEMHADETIGCSKIIETAAEVLDQLMAEV